MSRGNKKEDERETAGDGQRERDEHTEIEGEAAAAVGAKEGWTGGALGKT